MYKTIKKNFNKKTNNIKEKFISNPLDDILDVLKDISNFFSLAYKGLIWLIKFVIWLVRFLIYLTFDVLWFPNLFADIFSGSFYYPKIITETLLVLVKRVGNYIVDKFIGPLFKNIFGWDWTFNTKQKDIYKTEEGRIPITVIITTILLPPLGMFMRFGLSKWVNILITGCLTMIFYFPGLIYALVQIYT
jgi:uncharacterized membrane protein YqaE (UPF0057 family)